MIKMKLTKIVSSLLIMTSVFMLTPIGASASWKKDSKGWWYSIDTPWATGWTQINGKWYYFNADGYMAHDVTIDNYKLGPDGTIIQLTGTTNSNTSKEQITEVTVGTAQEFVNAIGSNKRILLKPGVYNLSTIQQNNNSDNSVVWENVYDGKELNIKNLHDLTIEGTGSGTTEIKVSPRYANIMKFTNVNNVSIKNIIAGHTPEPYECNAGVLTFNTSNDISIENSELYGCGSIGISLNSVKRLEASNCKIDHCSLRAIDISNSESIKFTNNKIINHEAFSNIVAVSNAKEVTFEKCEFADNNNFSWSFLEAADNSNVLLDKCIIRNNTKSTAQDYDKDNKYFFKTTDYLGNSNSTITVRDSEISNNKFDYLLDNSNNVKLENCTTNNNTWK